MNLLELITNIRIFLHDLEKTRWKDEEIVMQINNALANAARYTKYYRELKVLPVVPQGRYLALPDRLLSLISIEYNGCNILDRCSPICRKEIPKETVAFNTKGTNYNEIELLSQPPEWVQFTDLGNLGDLNTQLGVTDDNDATPTINGVLDTLAVRNTITIIYYAIPPKIDITNLTEEEIANLVIPIPEGFTELIQHYVQAFFLRSDRDSQSRVLGNEEYKLFLEDRRLLQKYASTNYDSIKREFAPISRRLQ